MNRPGLATAFLTAVLFVGSIGCDSSKVPNEQLRDIGTVTVEVDFGSDKRAKSIDVVCSPDSTVLDSLERAQNTNELKFEHSGSGETAFVNSIDGVKGKGAEGGNWTFRVNDQLGDKSAGIYEVKPGDVISWKFGDQPKELQ